MQILPQSRLDYGAISSHKVVSDSFKHRTLLVIQLVHGLNTVSAHNCFWSSSEVAKEECINSTKHTCNGISKDSVTNSHSKAAKAKLQE